MSGPRLTRRALATLFSTTMTVNPHGLSRSRITALTGTTGTGGGAAPVSLKCQRGNHAGLERQSGIRQADLHLEQPRLRIGNRCDGASPCRGTPGPASASTVMATDLAGLHLNGDHIRDAERRLYGADVGQSISRLRRAGQHSQFDIALHDRGGEGRAKEVSC